MTKLYDVGLLTLLTLMVLSAAGGYLTEKYKSNSKDQPTIQVNVDVDFEGNEDEEKVE